MRADKMFNKKDNNQTSGTMPADFADFDDLADFDAIGT